MMNILVESAARSVVLAFAVGLGLRIARARHARLQMAAWTLVLAGALVMPFLMQWRTIEIHAPHRVTTRVPVFVRTVHFSGAVPPVVAPTPRAIDWSAVASVPETEG